MLKYSIALLFVVGICIGVTMADILKIDSTKVQTEPMSYGNIRITNLVGPHVPDFDTVKEFVQMYNESGSAIYVYVKFEDGHLLPMLNNLGFVFHENLINNVDESRKVVGQIWLFRAKSKVPHIVLNKHTSRVIIIKPVSRKVLFVPFFKMYTFPGGTQDPGETFVQTVIRETDEEVGLSLDPSKLFHVVTMMRDPKIDSCGPITAVDTSMYFGYVLPKEDVELKFKDGEIEHARWLTLEEIEADNQIGSYNKDAVRSVLKGSAYLNEPFTKSAPGYHTYYQPERKATESKIWPDTMTITLSHTASVFRNGE
jgi:8-oxo-dGTP pyrophosphatase MutT (NUDIX family)